MLDDLNVEKETQIDPVVAKQPRKIDVTDAAKPSFKQKLKAVLRTKKGKVIAVIGLLIVILSVLFAIPTTRYAIAGLVIKKDVTVTVIDRDSHKPISGAEVRLGTALITKSDATGKATMKSVPVGGYILKVDKKYYLGSSTSYTVPILSSPQDTRPQLKATGRDVEVTITNAISSKPVGGATISISGSNVTTNEQGVARIMLPVKVDKQQGTVKASAYNDATFETVVTNASDQTATVKLTPKGEIYFLSKRTGMINVMKSGLDGGNQQVIVPGTGQESDTTTVLLSTTDWKYLVLQAARDSEKPKLYLIDTATGKLTVIDEGDVGFQLVGWSGHQFVYQVARNTPNYWDNKRQALKSYNADTDKLTTLDETQGSGTNYYDYTAENLSSVYAIGDTLVYTKTIDKGSYADPGDRRSTIISVKVNGSNKTKLKEFAYNDLAYFDARLYTPDEIYYRAVARSDGKATYYEYEDGKLAATADTNDQKFLNAFYPTYLASPSGNKTLWYEPRDGKNVIFIGDKDGNNGREIGVSDYVPYGWYSDDYVLFSKNGSELYILAQSASINEVSKPIKVTDYHKAQLNYPGYGGGYGGQ